MFGKSPTGFLPDGSEEIPVVFPGEDFGVLAF
jgi:hypothetical protein